MANIALRKNRQPTASARQQVGRQSVPDMLDPFRIMDRLLRWEPFQDMLGPALRQGAAPAFFPNFEVRETNDAYIFKADLPGVKDADIDVSITGNQLTVSGRREEEQAEDVQNYYVYERTYGSFTRTFTLPDGADTEHMRAELNNGVLTIVLPKKPEMQPRRIELGGGTQGEKAAPRA